MRQLRRVAAHPDCAERVRESRRARRNVLRQVHREACRVDLGIVARRESGREAWRPPRWEEDRDRLWGHPGLLHVARHRAFRGHDDSSKRRRMVMVAAPVVPPPVLGARVVVPAPAPVDADGGHSVVAVHCRRG